MLSSMEKNLKIGIAILIFMVLAGGIFVWNLFYTATVVQEMKVVVDASKKNTIELQCKKSSCRMSYELSEANFAEMSRLNGKFANVTVGISGHPRIKIWGASIIKVGEMHLIIKSVNCVSGSCILGSVCREAL